MGRYRARDLLLPPSLMSLARVPLALCFAWANGHPMLQLSLIHISEPTRPY